MAQLEIFASQIHTMIILMNRYRKDWEGEFVKSWRGWIWGVSGSGLRPMNQPKVEQSLIRWDAANRSLKIQCVAVINFWSRDLIGRACDFCQAISLFSYPTKYVDHVNISVSKTQKKTYVKCAPHSCRFPWHLSTDGRKIEANPGSRSHDHHSAAIKVDIKLGLLNTASQYCQYPLSFFLYIPQDVLNQPLSMEDHEYRHNPPKSKRSPCPALNALANHGYMYVRRLENSEF